jgi:uncharacterized membrane protein HdeD (DUF308 family)
MIVGLHNMIEGVMHYTEEHVTRDGGGWILLLDAILFIPLIFAVFFFPIQTLVLTVAAVGMTMGFVWLARALQRHRTRIGH